MLSRIAEPNLQFLKFSVNILLNAVRAADATNWGRSLWRVPGGEVRSCPNRIRFLLSRPHRIPRLVRLGRGASAATQAAAAATVAALEAL